MPRFALAVITLALTASACSSAGQPVATSDRPTPDVPTATAAPSETGDASAVETDARSATPAPTPTALPPPSPTTPPPTETTTTAAPTATVAPSRAGDGATLAGCTAQAPDPAEVASSTPVDIDGDDKPDTAMTYATDGGAGTEWRLRVETSTGASLEGPLTVEVGFTGAPRPLGGADIDARPGDELFSVVGAGASAAIVAIHVVEGCRLVPTHFGGFRASFAVGGTVGNLAGLQCVAAAEADVPATLVAWTGEADFDTPGDWQLLGTEYRLDGDELVESGARRLVANVREADFVYGQLTCGTAIL